MSELILEPRHTAVVVIDLQKGIVMMPGTPHPTPTVVANCARLLATARRVGAQPVLVHVGGSPDGADRLRQTADQPMRAATALSPDWSDLLPELDRQPSDIVILKRQWGAFYGTDLDLQLRRRGSCEHCPVRHRHRVRSRKHRARCLRARLRTGLRL